MEESKKQTKGAVKMNPELVQNLGSLFDFASPMSLRKSITFVYFDFLINMKHDIVPVEFTGIAEDMGLLIRFLQKAEEIYNEESKTL